MGKREGSLSPVPAKMAKIADVPSTKTVEELAPEVCKECDETESCH